MGVAEDHQVGAGGAGDAGGALREQLGHGAAIAVVAPRPARDHQEGFFTLGRWSESWILANDCAVLRRAGTIVGFAVVLRGAQDIEWTVDILRYQPELGLRALDFILLGLLRLARGRGVRRFDLGLTPTPDLSAENLSPTWRRVSRWPRSVFRSASAPRCPRAWCRG